MNDGLVKLVLLRHGQSVWNLENRYTGWTDVDLTEEGIREALQAAETLRIAKIEFDVVFTSVLKRAIRTVWIVLDQLDCMWLPVEKNWRLNERHYGALQGLDKLASAKIYGQEQVYLWRRSFRVRPPQLQEDDPRAPYFDRRYAEVSKEDLPLGESLEDAQRRVLILWQQSIAPRLRAGQYVLIVAHGNSLRALVTYLNRIPESEVPELHIPTGIPLLYELTPELRIVNFHYLGDPQRVKASEEMLRKQGMIRRGIKLPTRAIRRSI
ncbi:MAG: 2,3-diphosphoglycerate-dependent phosphoglycerate mutase [Anaerolineales bacterium]|jgi:2,3-bisphosphoglycerate-dependent phosphoglycerate mutase